MEKPPRLPAMIIQHVLGEQTRLDYDRETLDDLRAIRAALDAARRAIEEIARHRAENSDTPQDG